MLILTLTLEQLADCPEVEDYWSVISPFLWGVISPSLLGLTVTRIVFQILHQIFPN